MTGVQVLLVFLLVAGGLFTVVVPSLLNAAIGLAFTSVILSIYIYQLNAPLAAVFELSVCAGLITVVFVSAISLTRRSSAAEEAEEGHRHFVRFLPVLVITVLAAVLLLLADIQAVLPPAFQSFASLGAREALWEVRRFDVTGQLLIILAGVFGVVLLFKGWDRKETEK